MSFLCFALGWLTLAAAGNVVLLFSGLFEPLPRWLGLFALAYGVTAAGSMAQLWQMKQAGRRWLRAWMIICVAMLFAMLPVFYGQILGGLAGLLAFFAIIAILFRFLDRYVASALAGNA